MKYKPLTACPGYPNPDLLSTGLKNYQAAIIQQWIILVGRIGELSKLSPELLSKLSPELAVSGAGGLLAYYNFSP